MRLLAALLLLLPSVAAAQASRWHVVIDSTADQAGVWLDTQTIVPIKGGIIAWFKMAGKGVADTTSTGKPYVSSMSRNAMRCTAKESALAALTLYAADGSSVFSQSRPEKDWSFDPVLPESVGEVELRTACIYAITHKILK